MILTRAEILKALESGDITLSPFHASQLGPVSYDYRLGDTLVKCIGFDGFKPTFEDVQIPEEGYVLEPHVMYLGNSMETLGSNKYAMSLVGNASMGNLGLFMQVAADLGHTTSSHQWTLEIVATKPTRVYAGMKVGQVSFYVNKGELNPAEGTYKHFNAPHASVSYEG